MGLRRHRSREQNARYHGDWRRRHVTLQGPCWGLLLESVHNKEFSAQLAVGPRPAHHPGRVRERGQSRTVTRYLGQA